MEKVKILDCTLRDGGYVNQFAFGKQTIRSTVQKLTDAAIDIVECGFLQSGAFDPNRSLYGSVEAIRPFLPKSGTPCMYVAMIQFGQISGEEISPCDGSCVTGIRVTFHEHEIEDAFVLGRQLMDKGYQVFMQPVGTTTYTDEQLLRLIDRVNQLQPYAFYLVDTLGKMYTKDIRRMFYLVDNNLEKHILIGFHSHNNLQMSFSNAQELIDLSANRTVIIDASVLGMGRGAGNLCTELICRYVNDNFGHHYDMMALLEVIDQSISPLKEQFSWGYTPAYYLASIGNCHPNYASFFLEKQTLQMRDINAMLERMVDEKRGVFDKQYANQIYLEYLSHSVDDLQTREQLRALIGQRPVLLLAPGASLQTHRAEILEYIQNNHPFVISINFLSEQFPSDILFISNLKRFNGLGDLSVSQEPRIVLTSNISTEPKENRWIVNYSSYLNDEISIKDNAGLLCINLMQKIGVSQLTLAGFDGFALDSSSNFYRKDMGLTVEAERAESINMAVQKRLMQVSIHTPIAFLTPSLYEKRDQ